MSDNDKGKTHFRKAFNSPYLSSADIVEPTALTISHVRLEPDKSRKTKDSFNTAYFTDKELRPGEPLKPMILNACNSKTIKTINGSAFIDDWTDIQVTVWVDSNVRFGRDTVEGLRISEAPKRKTLKRGTQQWDNAIKAYARDGNLDKVTARVDISEDDIIAIKEAANELS